MKPVQFLILAIAMTPVVPSLGEAAPRQGNEQTGNTANHAPSGLIVDIEGAAASQGRAVDASIRLRRQLRNGMTVSAGYRGLEGGADNDELYTFAWLNYATFSVGWQFQ
jgi:hypothetical protein